MSSKVMASFSAFGGDFSSIAFIVLHSLEGSVIWSSVSTNCFHVFLRCSFVVLVISSFICCRKGEVESPDLCSSRVLILSNISAGTGSVLIRCYCHKVFDVGSRISISCFRLLPVLSTSTYSIDFQASRQQHST